MSTERIIGVAMCVETVEGAFIAFLPQPHRHHDVFKQMGPTLLFRTHINPDDQGFLTSEGRFVNRIEALEIAKRAGQFNRKPGGYDGPELFSEDLW